MAPTIEAFSASRAALHHESPLLLANWRLLHPIGEGRWSRVYRANPAGRAEQGPGDYAIKVLKDEHAASPECIEMLRCEGLLGRKLNHPHLIAVLGSHLQEPPYFLAFPYLEGATLAEALEVSGPLTVSHALWIARQLADALAALHAAGWIHGDVKPANVHISPTGHATLLDLGLAQPIETGRRERSSAFAGSVAYAAPETFCTAEPPTTQSDIYSLGVVLFEAITGRLPFVSLDPDCVAAAHLRETPPDVRSLVPHAPGRVARVVSRLLAKAPLRRPTAAECVELLTALEIETFGEGILAQT